MVKATFRTCRPLLFAALAAHCSFGSADPYAPPGVPLDPGQGTFARDARGRIERSRSVIRLFRASRPCPSTGLATGPCPGYVIDHIRALRSGGADAVHNLQWQPAAEAREKDRTE